MSVVDGRRARLAAFAAVLLTTTIVRAAEWQGTTTEKDGVLHVANPATAVEPMLRLEPEELWRIGGYSEAEGEFFGVISDIVFDSNGDIYLLDRQLSEVKVFTREGEWLRTIGREGEGPGEFRRPGTMFFMPNGELAIVQAFPGKIVPLTPDGAPGTDFPLRSAEDGGFRAIMDAKFRGGTMVFLGGNFKMGDGKMTRTATLARIGMDGDVAARFHETSSTNTMGNPVIREAESFGMPWDILPDGRVVASEDFSYRLSLWNPDGTQDRVVTRQYEPLKRSGDEVEAARKRLGSRVVIRGRGGRIEPTIEVEDKERDIQDLVVTEGGHIWVLSSRGSKKAPEGVCAVYDVYDADGHFLQQVSLVVDADLDEDRLVFSGDRLFVIKEYEAAARAQHATGSDEEADDSDEEAEPISVVCYRFEWQPEAVATPAR